MVQQIHRPMVPRTLEPYRIQPIPEGDARVYFEKYVRSVDPHDYEALAHLYSFGTGILDEQTVVDIIERATGQDDLYA